MKSRGSQENIFLPVWIVTDVQYKTSSAFDNACTVGTDDKAFTNGTLDKVHVQSAQLIKRVHSRQFYEAHTVVIVDKACVQSAQLIKRTQSARLIKRTQSAQLIKRTQSA